MKCIKNKTTVFVLIVFVLLIILTRILDLSHNIFLHPDEYVFYQSTNNMMNYIYGGGGYKVVKHYPEGAYAFQLPFHFICKTINDVCGCEISSQIAGRISSVFYSLLGFLVGSLILLRHFKCTFRTIVVYGVLSVFSIIHIEQSRYGTGDPITFFLLMLIIYFSANTFTQTKKGERKKYCYAAFLVCGMISAVKYPLVFFSFIPFSVLWRRKERITTYLFGLLFVIVGFLLISPQTVKDPYFLVRTIDYETKGYILRGNLDEVGGILNHFISFALYFTLYSGLILGPCYLCQYFKGNKCRDMDHANDDLDYVLFRAIPFFSILFCLYNMLTKTIFFRTFYPFFCIMDLYMAIGISRYLQGGKWKSIIAWALISITVARGGFYIIALSEKEGPYKLEKMSLEATNDSWNQTIILEPGSLLPIDESKYKSVKHVDLISDSEAIEEIDSDTLLISCSLDFWRGSPYILPVSDDAANRYITKWNEFTSNHSKYYKGSVYPKYYYYLFGYWIKGTTGTLYEFPSNYVYYH